MWNFADAWEILAERFAAEPAIFHGSVERSWDEFDRRACALARFLLDAGLERQDKVAQYCRNRPEYLESVFACFKGSLVPVNTNFRYGEEELAYLFDDSDTRAVVFDSEFADTCSKLRARLPEVRAWVCVGAACPDWAVSYDAVAEPVSSAQHRHTMPPWGRSGADIYLLYTGGTTGLPKGVMWAQHDLFEMLERQYGRTPPEVPDVAAYLGRLAGAGPRVVVGPPLMHGTASWFAMATLSLGGSVATLVAPRFDALEMLEVLVMRRAKGLCIVGDPFAKPILAELGLHPGRWDLSDLRLIVSSGAMLSRESKEGLIAAAPNARIVDGLGTSESGPLGTAVTTRPGETATAEFRLREGVHVIDEEGHDIRPGSGVAGRLAVGGNLPLGYYKDPAKTTNTFIEVDGRRFAVAGDWATVDSNGTIKLLGRGSGCINTAGEKVYPEEVEEVLKQATDVRDAAVVGVPDDRYGEAVVALVEIEAGAALDEVALRAHVSAHLAGYKTPKAIIEVGVVPRHANGKMDYRTIKALAGERLVRAPSGQSLSASSPTSDAGNGG